MIFFLVLADEIVNAIENADKLHALRLEGNTIGADAAKSIASALKKHPEYQVSRTTCLLVLDLTS